jgi:hypothetical protein
LECEKQALHREHAEMDYAQQRAKYEATQVRGERERVLAEMAATSQERTKAQQAEDAARRHA